MSDILMSDIKELYEQSVISVICPGCNKYADAVTSELRKHPQFVCPACGCKQQVDVDKLVNIYAQFFEQVEQVKQNSSGDIEIVNFPRYVDDDSETDQVN